ncbi:MAG: hypothetical protein IT555_12645 [Acetobacteraceae bacterium]|nr:hypothetical protein [Acetobacteraceae bacterium]
MPFDAPFQLGPFQVGADGGLALASPDSQPCMRLTWRGCPVQATLHAGGSGTGWGTLSLCAMVGRVPSTAGAPAALRRDTVFAALRALPATLPPGWRAGLLADHRVALQSSAAIAMPTSAERLLTDVTLFLLALGPYLDLLGEVGVAPPAAGEVAGAEVAAGMVNTWPG